MTEVNRKIHVIGINSYIFGDLSSKLQDLFLKTGNIAVPNSYLKEIKSWSENDLKKKKFLLFNIFFTLYIGINLIGGERGLISYFDKKSTYEKLVEEEKVLTAKLKNLDHKISLINKNDPDYLDMLYRQKFNYVTEDEIIIKLK